MHTHTQYVHLDICMYKIYAHFNIHLHAYVMYIRRYSHVCAHTQSIHTPYEYTCILYIYTSGTYTYIHAGIMHARI